MNLRLVVPASLAGVASAACIGTSQSVQAAFEKMLQDSLTNNAFIVGTVATAVVTICQITCNRKNKQDSNATNVQLAKIQQEIELERIHAASEPTYVLAVVENSDFVDKEVLQENATFKLVLIRNGDTDDDNPPPHAPKGRGKAGGKASSTSSTLAESQQKVQATPPPNAGSSYQSGKYDTGTVAIPYIGNHDRVLPMDSLKCFGSIRKLDTTGSTLTVTSLLSMFGAIASTNNVNKTSLASFRVLSGAHRAVALAVHCGIRIVSLTRWVPFTWRILTRAVRNKSSSQRSFLPAVPTSDSPVDIRGGARLSCSGLPLPEPLAQNKHSVHHFDSIIEEVPITSLCRVGFRILSTSRKLDVSVLGFLTDHVHDYVRLRTLRDPSEIALTIEFAHVTHVDSDVPPHLDQLLERLREHIGEVSCEIPESRLRDLPFDTASELRNTLSVMEIPVETI